MKTSDMKGTSSARRNIKEYVKNKVVSFLKINSDLDKS